MLKQSDAVALFLVDHFKSSDYFAMLAEVCPELAGDKPGQVELRLISQAALGRRAQRHDAGGRDRLGATCSTAAARHRRPRWNASAAALNPDDAINIQYTSGTTGFPKAATLSHRNLLLNAFYVGACQNYSADDRICIPVPFYHCFGCVLGTLLRRRLRRGDDRARRVVRPHGDARRHRAGARHGALRRADDVHRPAYMTLRCRAAT